MAVRYWGLGTGGWGRRRFLLLVLAALLPWYVQAQITVVGVDGHSVTLEQPAERIVTLAPHLTELVYAAGAGEQLVGVGNFSDYPREAETLPRVGDAYRLDLERIVALKPDLVLAWESGNAQRAIDNLRALRLAVLVTETRGLEGIAELIMRIGVLAGTQLEAEANATEFRNGIAGLRRRYGGRPTVSVFYQVAAQPLFTLSGRHFLNEVITLCGGRNVFSDLVILAPRVSEEAVLARDPDVIIAGIGPGQTGALARWERWDNLNAVKRGKLFTLPADLLHRPTPRLLEGARMMCEILERARE